MKILEVVGASEVQFEIAIVEDSGWAR